MVKTLKDIGCVDFETGKITYFVSKHELQEAAKEHIKEIEEYFQPDLAKTKTDWIKWFFNLEE